MENALCRRSDAPVCASGAHGQTAAPLRFSPDTPGMPRRWRADALSLGTPHSPSGFEQPPYGALLRHPPARIAPGLCYGRLDLPLAEGWRALLPGWLHALAPVAPAVVHCSPSRRCREPAQALADRLRIPLTLDPRLLELDFGAWEGTAWDRVPRPELDRWAADPSGFTPPRGETGSALIARVSAMHRALMAEARPFLVVSHGGPLRLLAAMLRGEPPDLLATSPPMGKIDICGNRGHPTPADLEGRTLGLHA